MISIFKRYYFPRRKQLENKNDNVLQSTTNPTPPNTVSSNIDERNRKFFDKLCFYFYVVGDKFVTLRNAVSNYGGSFDYVITEKTTHVVTTLSKPDEVNRLVQNIIALHRYVIFDTFLIQL
jgi:hypothetical protein